MGSERYWDPKKGREPSEDTGAKGLSEPRMYLRSRQPGVRVNSVIITRFGGVDRCIPASCSGMREVS